MTVGSSSARDDEAVVRFIERFATVFAEAGVPRMPARVFAALLATDSGRLSAGELADVLHVSPASISGAVRYLEQVDLASREREPGSRRDLIVVHDEVWYEAAVHKDRALARWEDRLREGIEAVERDSASARRMGETLAFFEFVRTEMPGLLDRWREHKAELRRGGAAGK